MTGGKTVFLSAISWSIASLLSAVQQVLYVQNMRATSVAPAAELMSGVSHSLAMTFSGEH
jgi:hypothetical protein